MNTMSGFDVNYRNPGHWDVTDNHKRLFRIRGAAPDVLVLDERPPAPPYPPSMTFKSVGMAMAWIADELMDETEKA